MIGEKIQKVVFIFAIFFVLPWSSALGATYQEALIAYKSNHHQKALTLIDEVIQSDPQKAKNYELRGEILTGLGKYEDAEKALFKALSLDSELHSCHLFLGENAYRSKRWKEASRYFSVHLRSVGPDPRSLLKGVYCFVATGNLGEAAKWQGRLDPVHDTDPSYYFGRAAILLSQKKRDQYQKILGQARTLYGNKVFGLFEKDLLFLIQNSRLREIAVPAQDK